MKPYEIVAAEAAETFKTIKSLNKTPMSNKARQDKIKEAKDKWWADVKEYFT